MGKVDFSYFWDDVSDKPAAKERCDLVLSKINSFCPKAKKVLELGVGNGYVLYNFPKGYSLYGIDVEEKYVKLAKKKLKKAKIYTKSMHNFKIKQKFDVIFSIFDSINYLGSVSEWKSTFKSVHSHLSKEGILIFDMYTEKALERFKGYKGPLRLFPKGYVCDFGIVDRNSLTWLHYIFEKKSKDTFKLHKYEFKEHIFPIGDIKAELKKYFTIVDFLQVDETRVLFVCKKNVV